MDLRSRLKKLEQAVTEPRTTAQHEESCICFPADEDLSFNSEESGAAARRAMAATYDYLEGRL